ncbi:MAG: hypothetical protein ACPHO6_09755, partial [Candidatus Latescibacterota bacterium]
VWSPSNLQDGRWWYWRVTTTSEVDVPDPVKRTYDDWSQTGYFYTDFNGGRPPDSVPDAVKEAVNGVSTGEGPQLLWPPNGSVVDTPNPNFRARAAVAEGDTIDFYFEVDRLPTFDGEFLQRSSDRPLLYEVLWEDLRFTGDKKDNDGDGRIDEEVVNGKDDDGDGQVDEDYDHPLGGKKWPIIAFGAGFGLTAYFTMAFLGMPIFLIWGYVQSVNGIPHFLIPQIIGALIGKYYFWDRFGKQEWRRYAMVLSVGFGVGMSLIGMLSAALAMINKAVSSLMY